MYILGISCYYHDSSVCLVKDGEVIVAIEEERLTRKKHDNSFPKKSIEFCLEYASISINDVDNVCFYERPDLKFHRFLLQHLRKAPLSFELFKNSFPHWLKTKINIEEILRKETGFKGKIDFVDHHTAHAASAFYPSPFDNAVILTIDGVGEWATVPSLIF